MLQESFFFLPSYKYGHLKRNFFCGTNVEEDVEDAAFPVFGFSQDYRSRGLIHIIFDPTIPGDYLRRLRLIKQKYALGAIELNSLN